MRLKNAYAKGVKLERKIVNEARAKGHIAFRSAGSHSPIDVVIIDSEHKIIYFYQCKAGKSYTDTEKERIFMSFAHLNGVYTAVWGLVDR